MNQFFCSCDGKTVQSTFGPDLKCNGTRVRGFRRFFPREKSGFNVLSD